MLYSLRSTKLFATRESAPSSEKSACLCPRFYGKKPVFGLVTIKCENVTLTIGDLIKVVGLTVTRNIVKIRDSIRGSIDEEMRVSKLCVRILD